MRMALELPWAARASTEFGAGAPPPVAAVPLELVTPRLAGAAALGLFELEPMRLETLPTPEMAALRTAPPGTNGAATWAAPKAPSATLARPDFSWKPTELFWVVRARVSPVWT